MRKPRTSRAQGTEDKALKPRALRADAQRNIDALLGAALAVFTTSGVEAPVREIADKAGVGVGTLYRHFPQRSDLIVAVFRQQVDTCANAATELAAAHTPGEALSLWAQRYADFIATKRGLATALHSGEPAFMTLPTYFNEQLRPALGGLLERAAEAGEVHADIEPDELLLAISSLCRSDHHKGTDYTRRMVDLLINGLRYPAKLEKRP